MKIKPGIRVIIDMRVDAPIAVWRAINGQEGTVREAVGIDMWTVCVLGTGRQSDIFTLYSDELTPVKKKCQRKGHKSTGTFLWALCDRCHVSAPPDQERGDWNPKKLCYVTRW